MENRRSNFAEKTLDPMATARMPGFELPSLRHSSEICIVAGDKPIRFRSIDLEECPQPKLQPMKHPSFQFYPGDWLRSQALRSCSVGARGLWIDMICLMHEGTPYGHLKVNQKVILPADLAHIAGATLEETEGWIKELLHAGVCSIKFDVIFCKRMLAEEEIRCKRAAGGRLGGNPILLKVNSTVNLKPNVAPPPASALRGKPSSEQEVVEFCESIGIPDGVYFWEKWTGNGFKNGGKAMKDWKATIRAWKIAGYLPSQKQNGNRLTAVRVSHVAKEGEAW